MASSASYSSPLSSSYYYETNQHISLPDDDLWGNNQAEQKGLAALPEELSPAAAAISSHCGCDNVTNIRPALTQQLQQVLREYKRQLHEESIIPKEEDPFFRCTICTLPGGTCEHTPHWLEHALRSKEEDPVEKEMKRLVDEVEISGQDYAFTSPTTSFQFTKQQQELEKELLQQQSRIVGIRKLQWVEPVVLPNDRLNNQIMDISSPLPRGGHTCVALPASSKLMVFGGLAPSNINGKNDFGLSVFQPYASHQSLDTDYGSVTNEVYFYSFMDCVWQKAVIKGNKTPPARMDHVATVIDTKHVWVFGGRGHEGQCLNDVWIFNISDCSWEEGPATIPCPSPRYAASAALVGIKGDVVMFGGRDPQECFGDLWVWSRSDKTWSSPLTVGVSPAPLCGHTMVAVSQGRILVLGGTTNLLIAPSEVPKSFQESFAREFELRKAADKLENCYIDEQNSVKTMGAFLKENASTMKWRELSQAAGRATAVIASRESFTNQAESEIASIEDETKIKEHWSQQKINEVSSTLAVTILDVEGGSFLWAEPSIPPISGIIPPGRMHFVANYMPKLNRLIVWGGITLIQSKTKTTRMDDHVYVLNLKTMHWSRPAVEDTKEILNPQINTTRTLIKRAKRNVEASRNRALSHSIPRGVSLEVAQTEATLAVYQWRLEQLQEEQKHYLIKPPPRFGLQGAVYGGRIFLFGGWVCDQHSAVGDLIALDLEQPDERERRLQDELALRLERERTQREIAELMTMRGLWYDELCRKKEEEAREELERKAMASEDHLSGFPHKTRGPKPKIKWANGRSAGIEWAPVQKDAKGLKVEPHSIQYILWIKGGYASMYVGREVLVEVFRDEKQKTKKHKMPKVIKGNSLISPYDLAYAKIKKDHRNGTFDVIFSKDGQEEENVPRNRLRPAQEPKWEVVYQGHDCQTEVMDIIPQYIREREPDYTCLCTFALQTIGIDYPMGEPSLLSEEVVTLLSVFGKTTTTQMSKSRQRIKTVRELDNQITLQSWEGEHWAEGTGKFFV